MGDEIVQVKGSVSTNAKRQVAVKSWISDLVSGRYVKVEGDWQPNYVLTPRNIKVSRANIMGAVVSEPAVDPGHFSFIIDDGSSKMTVRSFDESTPKDIILGDVLLVIGRPREFGSEIYMMPEIIKKIDNSKWLEHRKLELDLLNRDLPSLEIKDIGSGISSSQEGNSDILSQAEEERIEDSPETAQSAEQISSGTTSSSEATNAQTAQTGQEPTEAPEQEAANKEESSGNPIDSMLEIIRKLDTGNGADTEEAITDSSIEREKAEAIINNLLMDGEVFEIKPGMLKVME